MDAHFDEPSAAFEFLAEGLKEHFPDATVEVCVRVHGESKAHHSVAEVGELSSVFRVCCPYFRGVSVHFDEHPRYGLAGSVRCDCATSPDVRERKHCGSGKNPTQLAVIIRQVGDNEVLVGSLDITPQPADSP